MDVDLDGVKDVEIAQKVVDKQMTASVKKLTSPTQNYRFVLTYGGEAGEYGSVTFKFVSEGEPQEQPAIEMLFDDNGTYNREQLLTLKDGQKHNVMLSGRTLYRDGYWNTICLPFDLTSLTGTPLEGATVKELDTEGIYDGHQTSLEGTTLYLNFKNATSMEAGKPYIVRWATTEADIESPVFSGVTVTTETKEIPNPNRYSYDGPGTITVAAPTDACFNGGKFCGTYDPTVIYNTEHNKYYLGDHNTLYLPNTEGYSLKAFRAYFDLTGSASAREFKLNFDGSDTTGIISTTDFTDYTDKSLTPDPRLTPNPSLRGEGSDYWYSLDGRKLDKKPTRKGLYIYGGKKVVMK